MFLDYSSTGNPVTDGSVTSTKISGDNFNVAVIISGIFCAVFLFVFLCFLVSYRKSRKDRNRLLAGRVPQIVIIATPVPRDNVSQGSLPQLYYPPNGSDNPPSYVDVTSYSHISPNAETNVPLKGTFGIFPSHYKDDDDDDDDDDSYSTIDIVIIVLGTVIVFVFVLGLIFACCRLVKRKRAMRAQLIRNQTTVAIVTQQIPSAPPEDGTVQLPPYSPLPVFPDEPPPSYSPNWRPPPYPVQR